MEVFRCVCKAEQPPGTRELTLHGTPQTYTDPINTAGFKIRDAPRAAYLSIASTPVVLLSETGHEITKPITLAHYPAGWLGVGEIPSPFSGAEEGVAASLHADAVSGRGGGRGDL